MRAPFLASAALVSLALASACVERSPASADPSAAADPPSSEAQARADAAAEARAGVDDEALAALLEDHWLSVIETDPTHTVRGWGEFGAEGRARARARRAEWLGRARAIDASRLSERDRVSLEMFRGQLEAGEAVEVCEFWAWAVSTRDNPLEILNGAVGRAALGDAGEGEDLIARLNSFDPVLDAELAGLRDGLGRGLVADAGTLERILEMVEGQLAAPVDEWSLLTEPRDRVAEAPGWTAKERAAFEVELRASIEAKLRPGLERYAALLRDELIPAGRGPERVGVGALELGEACYAATIRLHTSEGPSPAELHSLGLAEIERIDAEIVALGEQQFGLDELPAILERLRSDPSLYFDSAEAVEAEAKASLAAAQAAAPKFFTQLPKTPCEVRRIPDYLAPYTYVGYYSEPTEDQPGYYYVNTSAPTTRPRFQARALAVHESVPGHHLQIALARELPETPIFRRRAGLSVFVEGWALYSERLAEDMGLYRDDLDRLGALSYDAWRAARLVVDTGIHDQGWTREQARAFMAAHTALAEINIVNEVDRYVSWPGQALAYKYGQLEILALRAEAEAALGDRFDLPGFHEVVLGAGAVSLPILRRRVRAWIAAEAG